jgi:RNA polymerase primary sigma factor
VQVTEDRTGIPPEVDEIAATLEMTVQKATELLAILAEPISIDRECDDSLHIVDQIPDTTSWGPEESVHRESLRSLVRKLPESLPPREAWVIRMRFGIDCDDEHTLEEIGKVIGVSRERIRQREAQAFTKLGHPGRIRQLVDSI